MKELQKGSNVKNTKADKIKKKFGIKNQDNTAKTKESLKQEVQAKGDTQKGRSSSDKTRPSGTMPESSTESWERKPSLSRTLPPSWRSRHSGAKYGRTARPIMMLLTGSKTEPKKTSISQLRNGPSTRPVIGNPRDATAWLTSGSNKWSAYTTNLPMPTAISSRTQNSPQSGWPRVWLSWYQTSKTPGTLKSTGLSHAYHLCTRPWPPSLQKGPTYLSKVTTCSPKFKKDAAAGAMAAKTNSSSTKPSLRRWDPRAVSSPRRRLTTRRPSIGCPTSGSSRASNSTRSAPLSPASCGKTWSRGRRSSA